MKFKEIFCSVILLTCLDLSIAPQPEHLNVMLLKKPNKISNFFTKTYLCGNWDPLNFNILQCENSQGCWVCPVEVDQLTFKCGLELEVDQKKKKGCIQLKKKGCF
ncbi:uncharacterized protein LOC129004900 [Macrosteles quadrilineatus]|uniref:uncharacterized protein LOC129004900 n=1 Tax=Macrosteles quadrilineatus TaxID=74068 RepID=UPI0023E160A9|nr:uncharacterized protein LOC129004900 [Macrosteles quadrilineatus]